MKYLIIMNNISTYCRYLLFILTIIFAGNYELQSQQLAFPGAEGYGCHTSGGRGGTVYIVDNLTDDVRNPQEGSLRWAVEKQGTRIVVFAVSGTIALEGSLFIGNNNITVAGQTAPGDGICVKNYVVTIGADNVIIRYLRFRCGNEASCNASQDAMNCKGSNNVIIDHCSFSWSIDETASFYDNHNFTLQWCMITESLNNGGHPKGAHGFGAIWGGMNASFHHNLFAHHSNRNPRFCGARYHDNSQYQELVDFRNNVIFNWGNNNVYGGENGFHNMIANYYKPGPATRYNSKHIVEPYGNNSQWYVAQNFLEGSKDVTKNNSKGINITRKYKKETIIADKPFDFAPVQTQSAKDAYTSVLKDAGAVLPKRDAIDARIIEEVKTGVCRFGDSWGKNTGIIDSQKSVGGWPELKTYDIKPDSDKDGMPDEWEKQHGLNPSDASDNKTDRSNDGYTNIEEYINSITE